MYSQQTGVRCRERMCKEAKREVVAGDTGGSEVMMGTMDEVFAW